MRKRTFKKNPVIYKYSSPPFVFSLVQQEVIINNLMEKVCKESLSYFKIVYTTSCILILYVHADILLLDILFKKLRIVAYSKNVTSYLHLQ